MHDGSRYFADLPESAEVETPSLEHLRARVAALPGVDGIAALSDGVTEAWLDWRYAGHEFSANTQSGTWWMSVKDPSCPDDLLRDLLTRLACD
jgi:hypothetical protein